MTRKLNTFSNFQFNQYLIKINVKIDLIQIEIKTNIKCYNQKMEPIIKETKQTISEQEVDKQKGEKMIIEENVDKNNDLSNDVNSDQIDNNLVIEDKTNSNDDPIDQQNNNQSQTERNYQLINYFLNIIFYYCTHLLIIN